MLVAHARCVANEISVQVAHVAGVETIECRANRAAAVATVVERTTGSD